MTRSCLIERCGGKHRAKGLCSKHYQFRYRRLKTNSLEVPKGMPGVYSAHYKHLVEINGKWKALKASELPPQRQLHD